MEPNENSLKRICVCVFSFFRQEHSCLLRKLITHQIVVLKHLWAKEPPGENVQDAGNQNPLLNP